MCIYVSLRQGTHLNCVCVYVRVFEEGSGKTSDGHSFNYRRAGSSNSGIVVERATTAAVAVCWPPNRDLTPAAHPSSFPCFSFSFAPTPLLVQVSGAAKEALGGICPDIAELAAATVLRNV